LEDRADQRELDEAGRLLHQLEAIAPELLRQVGGVTLDSLLTACAGARPSRPAGSAVKSASSPSRNAALVTSPNCRSGGKLENDSARNPAALINVAKTLARPETRSACASASASGAPSRSWRWWKK